MAQAVGLSDLQDDLNASGYDGLINLNIVRGTMYTGSPSSSCKVPALYPCATALDNLANVAGVSAPLGWNNAVILGKTGNFRERLYIYAGQALDFTVAEDVAVIRQKLIDWAHADGLYPPTLIVTAPNGGEALAVGSSGDITWNPAGTGGSVKIDLLKGGSLYSTIADSTSNDGSYTWNVPADHETGSDYRLRITPISEPAKVDESNADFSIVNIIYERDMSSDPGWTLPGLWDYGQPQGVGTGGYYSPANPTAGYTGNNVVGYNLIGAYDNNMGSTEWATSDAFDCSYYTGVTLTFYRWLGVESPSWDHAYIEAKNGSGTWQSVWENTSAHNVGSWQYVSYDISAIADGQSGVQVRWGIGPTDDSYNYCGWNIDDVRVIGEPRTTANGTPYVWLADHGITSNQEVEDAGDTDGDGSATWEEYQAGTNPTNAASVFCVLAFDYLTGSNCVYWYGTTNSGVTTDFVIYRATDLVSSNWQAVGTNSRSSTGTNFWWDSNPPAGVPVYYRPALPLP